MVKPMFQNESVLRQNIDLASTMNADCNIIYPMSWFAKIYVS